MIPAYMLGLLPDGEALYTDSFKPIEAQKQDAMGWLRHYDNLISVHAVVGGTISDITAAFCRMWINNADLSDYCAESDFPDLVRETVPELIAEVLSDREEEATYQRELRSDYYAGLL